MTNKHEFNEEITGGVTEDSFPQNPYFTEKNLEKHGMIPPFDGDNDVRTITRQKVVSILNSLAVSHFEPSSQANIPHEIKSSNEWIFNHHVLTEVPISLFQIYIQTNLSNSPQVFYTRYRSLLHIQQKLSWFLNKKPENINEEELLSPSILNWLSQTFSHNENFHKLLNQLNKKAVLLNYIEEPIKHNKPLKTEKNKHPKVISYSSMKQQQRLSKDHIRKCCSSIHEFFSWLIENDGYFITYNVSTIPIQLITNKQLQNYKRYLINLIHEGERSPITCSHKLYNLIDFFNYMFHTYGYNNPLRNFKSIHAPRYKPRKLPNKYQLHTFFKVIKEYSTTSIQDTIAYLFMSDLGMRLIEVASITWDDINLGIRTISIHSKGHKSHLLPLTKNLYRHLVQFKQESHTSNWLFSKSPASTYDNLYTNFKIYTLIAGWNFPGGVHLFRHLFVTRLAKDSKVPPQLLKDLARVTSLDTLSLYLQLGLSSEFLIQEINKIKI